MDVCPPFGSNYSKRKGNPSCQCRLIHKGCDGCASAVSMIQFHIPQKVSHTYSGVSFAWAETLQLKSILTLVGNVEYSPCVCVKEREMECWHLVNFSILQNAKNIIFCVHFIAQN